MSKCVCVRLSVCVCLSVCVSACVCVCVYVRVCHSLCTASVACRAWLSQPSVPFGGRSRGRPRCSSARRSGTATVRSGAARGHGQPTPSVSPAPLFRPGRLQAERGGGPTLTAARCRGPEPAAAAHAATGAGRSATASLSSSKHQTLSAPRSGTSTCVPPMAS